MDVSEWAALADPYRAFVFPNKIREVRPLQGYSKLLRLAAALPEISYIRLSKIERGEVFARGQELRRISQALATEPERLIVDIETPGFQIAEWATPFFDPTEFDAEAHGFATLLAAAFRLRRQSEAGLTVASLEARFGIAPVNLSRIETAAKPFDRWNRSIQRAIFGIMGVEDAVALRTHVVALYRAGELDDALKTLTDPAARIDKWRGRIAQLRSELKSSADTDRSGATPPIGSHVRMLPVRGAPRAGGLVAPEPVSGLTVEAPIAAGPRAFALRVCRPVLGPGFPAHAVAIVDPDRHPQAGGIVALCEADGHFRWLAVDFDAGGKMRGTSVQPELIVDLERPDPSELAAVVAVVFP